MISFALIVFFTVLLCMNVPVAFALGGAAILALGFFGSVPLMIVPQQILAGTDSFPMLAIPLFILSGALMDIGGISDRLIRLAKALVGHFRGGMGMVVVVAEIFFSDISGSTSADTAAIGGIMIPQLVKDGYSASRATAITAAACGMGMLVPPCITMVIYGVMGGVSIGELFAAGFIPAFIMAAALMAQIYIQAVRAKLPRETGNNQGGGGGGQRGVGPCADDGRHHFRGDSSRSHPHKKPGRGCRALAILIGMFVYRQVSVKAFIEKLVETGKISGMVLLLIGTAHTFSWVLRGSSCRRPLRTGC